MKPLPPVLTEMCGTCPWRPGSPHANLVDHLTESALKHSSRICHSTGTSAIYGRTGKPPALCRGARDVQLRVFFVFGMIKEPTDEAWAAAWAKWGKRRARA